MGRRIGSARLGVNGVIGEFYERLDQEQSRGWMPKLAMRIDSDQETESYIFAGMTPALRESVGGRNIKQLANYDISITNKDYESSVGIKLKDWRRDKTGQLVIRVGELAQRAVAKPASLASTLMLNGTSAVCYDGQYFYDTDHSEGDSGTQSNDLAITIANLPSEVKGTTTLPSPSQMAHCIMQAIQAMLGFKDDQGEPVNEGARSFLVMVPITLFGVAKAAVGATLYAGGESNVIGSLDGFTIEVEANARLTWTDAFTVSRTDGVIKPFIHQVEVEPTMGALDENSEYCAINKELLFYVDMTGAVDYGDWKKSVYVDMD